MKTLSVRQPWANLIVHGIKDIENRSWRTTFRGRVLIHAPVTVEKDISLSVAQFNIINEGSVELQCSEDDAVRIASEVVNTDKYPEVFNYRKFINFKTSAIIGSVNILDCIPNSESIWADSGCWHWVLSDPELFKEPILNVKGKLSLWEYEFV